MDKFNDLTELMAGAEKLSPPPEFSSRVMSIIQSGRNARSAWDGARRPWHALILSSRRPVHRSRIVEDLLQLIALPGSPGQIAMAFLNMGFFFLVTGLVFLLMLDFPFAGVMSPLPFLFFVAPAFLSSMGLMFLGWRAMRRPDTLTRTGSGLVSIAALFGLSALSGLLFQRPPEPALAGLCLGMSGLAATAFLALGVRRCLRQTCNGIDFQVRY